MSSINWKLELKLKSAKYCVLSASGNNNDNDRDDKIIFAVKDTKLCIPIVTL